MLIDPMWDRDTRKTFDVDYFNTHNNNTHKKYASSLYFGVYVYSIYGDDDVLYFYDEYILRENRERHIRTELIWSDISHRRYWLEISNRI